MIRGVKNCTPRARFNALPMAALRIAVGKSSEKKGPKFDQVPVPTPRMAMEERRITGDAAIRSQNSVMRASPAAMKKE